jgi:hypothetical protein
MPPEHYPWIAKRASLVIGSQFRAIEAIDSNGRVHGAVGYDGWTPGAVCVHVALDHPAALRHLLKPGFRIPFDEFGRKVVLATVLSSNARSLALVTSLGFIESHRIVDGWSEGVDMVLFEMRRGNCRWLAGENTKHKEAKSWAA